MATVLPASPLPSHQLPLPVDSGADAFVWVCDQGGCLLSAPQLWSERFQILPQTVVGRAWLTLLHPEDVPLVLNCFVSLLNPAPDKLLPIGQPERFVVRFGNAQSSSRYQVQALPLLLGDLTYYWVFVASSLEPTVTDYAERNLLAVLTVAVSLAHTVLQSLSAMHHECLRPPLCRRLDVLTDQIHGYLNHLEQGVRYLTQQRQP